MRGIHNLFLCTQCDKTPVVNGCETCNAVHKPANKAVWVIVLAHGKPGVRGSVRVWICHKCIASSYATIVGAHKFIWDYTNLIQHVVEGRQKNIGKRYRIIS